MTRLAMICWTLVMLALLVLTSHPGGAEGPVTSAQADLNGDGKKEKISLQIKEDGPFVLQIAKASVKGRLSYDVEGFQLVDIDKKDKYVEVAVYTPGPSDDDEYLIYWYDGKAIKEMGHLERWPTFTGNGVVYVDDWKGFWKSTDKYVLDQKTRTLKRVPQEFYYVGLETTVGASIPIYETRKSSAVVANLQPKSKALILLYSQDGYYLIKSVTGLVGWVKDEETLYGCFTDLPNAD